MTRSPTLLLRRLFGEQPTLKLPLGRLFRRAYVHAQYESGHHSESCSMAIPGKQRAANWADFVIMIRNQSLSWLRGPATISIAFQPRLFFIVRAALDGLIN
jgi:hypothetical protein